MDVEVGAYAGAAGKVDMIGVTPSGAAAVAHYARRTLMTSVSGARLTPIFLVLIACFLHVASARAQPNLVSRHRPGEFDTADRNGQAGGKQWGAGYGCRTLRCGNGEAIVGARIRRGDVLDFLQVACAAVVCTGNTCQWSQYYWGPWAGNSSGGDAHPPMVCDRDQIVSGFRGRVVTFSILDYAADIELQCSRISSASAPSGPFLVTSERSSWHQSEGGLRINNLPPNFRATEITGPITCRPYGGATAISTGVSNFVLLGQRVVQAVSLYCPSTRSPATDQALFPKCLYNTAAYQSGQVPRLVADTLVQGLAANSYNCFAYAETFVLGSLPNPLFGRQNTTITPQWLNQNNYALIASANTLGELPPSQLGDLVMVENKVDTSVGSYPWYHVAIVIGVDSAGRISRLRQKPDSDRCVFDTTSSQFMSVDPVQGAEQYELWRNPFLNWSETLAR
jgi:hypothetical protein